MQALKSEQDDQEGEGDEGEAIRHKNEGNKFFAARKYRWAIDSYTSGQCLLFIIYSLPI
jgi:hypothetical protein